jgi:hypothetical protein
VLITVAVLFGIPALWLQLFIAFEDILPWFGPAMVSATLSVALLVAFVHLLLWYRRVRWNARRVLLTALATVTTGILAVLVYVANEHWWYEEPGIIIAGLIWACAWVCATAFIWRETRAERALRTEVPGAISLNCPRCGYNLRGLREARCPECGTEYTLEELLDHFRQQNPHPSEVE